MSDKIIIYNSTDGRSNVALMARDGMIWLSQSQMAELFATSKQNISIHIDNILSDNELSQNSVVKDYLTTAADGKEYIVRFYSLPMIVGNHSVVFPEMVTIGSNAERQVESIRINRYVCYLTVQDTDPYNLQ